MEVKLNRPSTEAEECERQTGGGFISRREILEHLAMSEFRAGRMTRRGYAEFIRMAKEYRFTEREAECIVNYSRERLRETGFHIDVDDTHTESTDKSHKLVKLAMIVVAIQLLWWILL